MKATLSNYRQSPRKVRLVANLLKGKTAERALMELKFLPKRASDPIAQLLSSAIANAKTNSGIDKENLIVKSVSVDKGTVLKRHMPRARGSAARINKRSSHVTLVLTEKETKNDQDSKTKIQTKPKKLSEKKVKAKA